MPDGPIRAWRGERIYLRPREPEDEERIQRWYEDARVVAILGELPQSLTTRRASRARADDAPSSAHQFVICLLDDDRAIGRCDLFEIDERNGSCALGIMIGEPDLWGQGLGTDTVNVLVDFAFGQLRMERVWLDTDSANLRAQASYAKAGFVEEGRLRHAYYQDGAWLDGVRMAILRDDWKALRRSRSWELAAEAVDAVALSGHQPTP
ncbi:MAG: GNAT family N-acetyltransferase [Candidatus Limnocylindrales bacterium]